MLAYLGAMLAHLGAMLAHLEGNVGPSWGNVGPSWGYVGPSWGLCWPILGLCWPMLGLCWPILRPMLAHVDPSQTTRSAQNIVKRGSFWRSRVVGGRGWRPLSPTERREPPTAMPRDFWADAPRRLRRTTRPSISSQCGRESY